MTEHTLTFDGAGGMQFIHSDDLEPLLCLGDVSIQRVSNVEWDGERGGWCAAMVGGPVLGPYRLRGNALASELDWLRKERGL